MVCRLKIPTETITVHERSNADDQDSNPAIRPTSTRPAIRYISVGKIPRQINFPSGRHYCRETEPQEHHETAQLTCFRCTSRLRPPQSQYSEPHIGQWSATEELPPRQASTAIDREQAEWSIYRCKRHSSNAIPPWRVGQCLLSQWRWKMVIPGLSFGGLLA